MRTVMFCGLFGAACTPGTVITATGDCDECDAGDPGTDSAEADTDADTDSDTDSDSDSDADSDTDSDTDSDADADADPVDNDGDGYTSQIDCDDGDGEINPGATEVCNDVDDDCDGNVDEALDCEDEEMDMFLSVDHGEVYDLMTLNYQPIWDLSEIGDSWWDSETVTHDDVVAVLAIDDFEGILGIRLNVTRSTDQDNDGDYDSSSWLCEGHYLTAAIDGSVSVDVSLDGDSWDEDDLVTWSPGDVGDISLGCSALLWFGDTDDITEGFVQ